MPSESQIQFSGEIVVEFRQKFNVEEEDGSGGELGGDDVEEDLGAGVFVFGGGAGAGG
ncbi:MAG: hypothetical protein Q9222_005217 [Ikaeria aurantiellina]